MKLHDALELVLNLAEQGALEDREVYAQPDLIAEQKRQQKAIGMVRKLLVMPKSDRVDDRIIVHYEKWADGTIKSGAKLFGDLNALRLAYPDWRYRLVERPIATRRGSAMMGGGK